jgi:hypothetical protein
MTEEEGERQTEERERKIRELQQEINDLRQGLAAVADYDALIRIRLQERGGRIPEEEVPTHPAFEEHGEFESLWHFLDDRSDEGIGEGIPTGHLYGEYLAFCRNRSLTPMEQDAFVFLLLHGARPAANPSGNNPPPDQ